MIHRGVAACNFNQAPTAALHPNFINRFEANLGLDPFEHINMATVLGEKMDIIIKET